MVWRAGGLAAGWFGGRVVWRHEDQCNLRFSPCVLFTSRQNAVSGLWLPKISDILRNPKILAIAILPGQWVSRASCGIATDYPPKCLD